MKHTDRKRESAGDRKRQRQAEQARIKAENEPIHLRPDEPAQQQISERGAHRTGIPEKVGRQHAAAEEKYHQQKHEQEKRQTVAERMGRVVRPAEDDDPKHRHGHKL